MDVTIGTFTKPKPAERESELIETIDALIAVETGGTLEDGQKPYAEVTVPDEKTARKFMYEMQLGARQRDHGFRRTRFEVLDDKGKHVKQVDGVDSKGRPALVYPEDKVASVIIGGVLGARHKANGTAESDD